MCAHITQLAHQLTSVSAIIRQGGNIILGAVDVLEVFLSKVSEDGMVNTSSAREHHPRGGVVPTDVVH